MRTEETPPAAGGFIQIERHGDIAVILPTNEVEAMQWEHIEQAAEIVLNPLQREPAAGVIVDLKDVSFFGSIFLSLLLRCHKMVKQHGGELVLCNTTEKARELLRLTALDTIWAIYDSREQAFDALS
jgi:anti-anti-sigma factor